MRDPQILIQFINNYINLIYFLLLIDFILDFYDLCKLYNKINKWQEFQLISFASIEQCVAHEKWLENTCTRNTISLAHIQRAYTIWSKLPASQPLAAQTIYKYKNVARAPWGVQQAPPSQRLSLQVWFQFGERVYSPGAGAPSIAPAENFAIYVPQSLLQSATIYSKHTHRKCLN